MVSKRFAFVLLIVAALCGYIALYSGTNARSDGSPIASSPPGSPLPTPVLIGGVEPNPKSVLENPDIPACIECYFGLWQLNVTGETEIAPIGDRLMAFVVSGSVTLDPDIPGIGSTFDETSEAFPWLTGETVTASPGDDSATLYFFGLVPGRGASDIPGLELLGGAAFQAQPAQPYTFIIGKVTLDDESDQLIFEPDTWPAILNVTEGDIETTTAQASLTAEDRAIGVTSFDELGPGVQVLEPATLVRITPVAGSDGDVVIWFAGIYSDTPTGGPGCGWHCRG